MRAADAAPPAGAFAELLWTETVACVASVAPEWVLGDALLRIKEGMLLAAPSGAPAGDDGAALRRPPAAEAAARVARRVLRAELALHS